MPGLDFALLYLEQGSTFCLWIFPTMVYFLKVKRIDGIYWHYGKRNGWELMFIEYFVLMF